MIWRTLYNALTLCQFQIPRPALLLDAMRAVTGEARTLDEFLADGRRILELKREINRQRGLTSADDRLPDALLRSLAEGGTQGNVPDLAVLLAGAYEEFGWS